MFVYVWQVNLKEGSGIFKSGPHIYILGRVNDFNRLSRKQGSFFECFYQIISVDVHSSSGRNVILRGNFKHQIYVDRIVFFCLSQSVFGKPDIWSCPMGLCCSC